MKKTGLYTDFNPPLSEAIADGILRHYRHVKHMMELREQAFAQIATEPMQVNLDLDIALHLLYDAYAVALGNPIKPAHKYMILDGAAYVKWYRENVAGIVAIPERWCIVRLQNYTTLRNEPYAQVTYPETGAAIPMRFLKDYVPPKEGE